MGVSRNALYKCTILTYLPAVLADNLCDCDTTRDQFAVADLLPYYSGTSLTCVTVKCSK